MPDFPSNENGRQSSFRTYSSSSSSNLLGLELNEAAVVMSSDTSAVKEVTMKSMPCWLEEGDDDPTRFKQAALPLLSKNKCHLRKSRCVNDDESSSSQSNHENPQRLCDSSCLFDNMSEEVSALILAHLSLAEISAASLVSWRLYQHCRSNALWKILFQHRWNVKQYHNFKSEERRNSHYYYFEGYRTAHSHPYDLWITHSNCVFPSDGLSPGRCCIIDTNTKRCSRERPRDSSTGTTSATAPTAEEGRGGSVCPYCRNWDDTSGLPSAINTDKNSDATSTTATPSSKRTSIITTQAQEMARATMQTRRKFANYPTLLGRDHGTLEDNDSGDNDDNTPRNACCAAAQKRAFAVASTFHRQLDIRQYYSSHAASRPPTFLTDLLFFNLTDPIHSDGQWELEQLLRELMSSSDPRGGHENHEEDSSFMNLNYNQNNKYNHESSNHSWHIIQLTNPDFYRPLVFQFGIQRPECFTVYPSEGYLAPGQSTFVTLGVRPLGSALAYAFEALNAQREGLQPTEWAELYTRQAHLPLTPFFVRYRFTSSNPVWIPPRPPHINDWNDPATRRINNQNNRHTRNDSNHTAGVSNILYGQNASTLAFHWDQPVPAHRIHCIHLSAHVHAHYLFDKFLQETCHMWDNNTTYIDPHNGKSFVVDDDDDDDNDPLHFRYNYPPLVAPALHERFPSVYQRLARYDNNNFKNNLPSNSVPRRHPRHRVRRIDLDSHTEGPCQMCRRFWGVREEELVHAHIVMRGECEWQRQRRQKLLNNVILCLHWIDGQPGDAAFLAALLYKITLILQEIKGAPWLGPRQRGLVLQLEAGVDQLYCQLPPVHNDDNVNAAISNNDLASVWNPWRLEGVYRYALCTDSVFGGIDRSSSIDSSYSANVIWKDEPDFLDSFRHLAHSPGLFCLGPQEDPNHIGETVVATSKRYLRVQNGLISDLFMDDPISALQAGICMMHSPRSLLVHGLYDRIPYAGTLVRRPKLLPPHLLKPEAPAQLLSMLLLQEPTPQQCSNDIIDRVIYYRWQNALDLSSILFSDAASMYQMALLSTDVLHVSLENYLEGATPPGSGRFALSRVVSGVHMMQRFRPGENFTGQAKIEAVEFTADIVPTLPLHFTNNVSGGSLRGAAQVAAGAPARVPQPPLAHPRNIPNARPGPRFLQLLVHLGAHMGLAVIEGPDSCVFVDRRILIATQWVCISLMAFPMLLTLFARYIQWIPSRPIEYELQGLPFEVGNEMRYLTPHECGVVAVLLVLIWLAVGRWTERHLHRDFFRIMLDHITPRKQRGFFRKMPSKISLFAQRQWDALCPLFLQRRVFVPDWNRRSRADIIQHINFWKSQNLPEQRAAARAINITQVFGCGSNDCRDQGLDVDSDTSARNIVVGLLVALGSFCSSSPHFWLNFFTVFSCSIGLGISMSLHSVEKGALGVNVSSTGSLLTTLSLATVVILSFLIGQLVGSSGGTMFMAEFIVTSISLLLGGAAGTISASAVESWGCFFCLSCAAFWGYLFGRVSIIDGIRRKRGGSYSCILLSKSIAVLCVFWILVFFVGNWDAPLDVMVLEDFPKSKKHVSKRLQ